MATLTSLLARDAIVSLDTIEQALQRQVLEGGELDSALLELTSVGENVLAAYRAASFRLAPAARAELEQIDSGLLARVPAELARERRIVPIAVAGDSLVLASAWPLSAADLEQVGTRLSSKIELRIATEARLEAALARHYGVELGSRMRLLSERLAKQDPGELCAVQPLVPSQPVPPPAPPAERPAWKAGGTIKGRAPIDPVAAMSATVVRVLPMVTLGSANAAAQAARRRQSELPPEMRDTRRSRPSQQGRSPAADADAPRPARKLSGSPRGPLTRKHAIELLGQAQDRDRVLDVFFSFARQYFECTVLFALRDERLLGLDAFGLPALADLHTVEVPIPAGGSVQDVVNSRAARVSYLSAAAADGELVRAIGREQAQPCALVPVLIRQRVVSLLYGDRDGEPIALSDISELVVTLPNVSVALERIIQERKREAIKAQKEPAKAQKEPTDKKTPSGRSSRETAAPQGAFGHSSAPSPPQNPEPEHGNAPQPAAAPASAPAEGPPVTPNSAAAPSPALGGGVADAAPQPAHGAAAPPPAPDPEDDELASRPTVHLARGPIARGLLRPSERPPAPGPVEDAPSEPLREPLHKSRREADVTRPARPSRLAAAGADAMTSRSPADPPAVRTLSQPPPGVGTYAVRDTAADVLPKKGTAADVLPKKGTTTRADGAPAPTRQPSAVAPKRAPAPRRDPPPPVAAKPAARQDPRRDGSRRELPAERVSIPSAMRGSFKTPRESEGDGAGAIVVDLQSEAARVVEELCRCGPDEERPQVASLLRLGDSALAVLERRFPGPLWFERHKPRTRMPPGRDISAIARALYAFEDRAVPHIAALLAATDTEVRLCAAMLAADLVRPGLLWPMYQRLFDPDGSVRLTAIETLPLFRNVAGFEEVLKSLRQKAAAEGEAIPNRLAAIEAISSLRDAGSIELLSELCVHGNRQLSVPAHRTLVAISGQDFGGAPRKWKQWIEKNRVRHRAEWLIEGLMHPEERVRATAGVELQKLSQVYYGFSATASKRDRERVQRRYLDWWQKDGRAQFGR